MSRFRPVAAWIAVTGMVADIPFAVVGSVVHQSPATFANSVAEALLLSVVLGSLWRAR